MRVGILKLKKKSTTPFPAFNETEPIWLKILKDVLENRASLLTFLQAAEKQKLSS